MQRALDLLAEFPVPTVAGAVLLDGAVVDHEGPMDHRFRLASIAKTITVWAILIAVEEGIVALDDEVGPPPTTRAPNVASPARPCRRVRIRRTRADRQPRAQPDLLEHGHRGGGRPRGDRGRDALRGVSPTRAARPARMSDDRTAGVTGARDVVDRRRPHPLHAARSRRRRSSPPRPPRTPFVPTSPRWEVSFRAWDVSTRARGEWGSKSVGTSLLTGRERTTLRQLSATSVVPAR